MKKGESFVYFDKALAVWEDMCWIHQKLFEKTKRLDPESSVPFGGPLHHFMEFRRYLLENGLKRNFDYDKFVGSQANQIYLMNLDTLPLQLFTWTVNSRRVFHIPSALQTLFSAISLEGIYWPDIVWPFESFALILEDPFTDVRGIQYDCILVGNVASCVKELAAYDIFYYSLFSPNLKQYTPLDKDQKHKIEKTIRKWEETEIDKLYLDLEKLGKNYVNDFHITTRGFEGPNIKPVNELCNIAFKKHALRTIKYFAPTNFQIQLASEDTYQSYSECDKAKHLVLSLCLYLSTLPTTEKSSQNWSPLRNPNKIPRRWDKKAITDEAKIFSVSCKSILTSDDYETIREINRSRTSGEKCVHWRRGHWRKKPGFGNDPAAPKDVMVKPCLVNADRLMENALPAGNATLIK